MGTNTKKSQEIIWITWEKQRRSISLAKLLNAEYIELSSESSPLLRYITSIYISALKILGNHKSVIIVQSPSIVLAFIATVLGKLLSVRIIVDRHTDRYILGVGEGLIFRILMYISNFTIKNAGLTIITNVDLIDKVEALKGKPFVLPDPFPDVKHFVQLDNGSCNHDGLICFVVASWSSDEPLEQLFEAAACIPEINMFISGKPKNAYSHLINNKPGNVYITDYLSDIDYYSFMHQSDIIIAITTADATLVCGGYEAIVLNKPLLTGNSNSLKKYYEDVAVYTDGTTDDLIEKIHYIIKNQNKIISKTKLLKNKREREFSSLLESFHLEINKL